MLTIVFTIVTYDVILQQHILHNCIYIYFFGRRSTTGFAPRSIRCALLIFFYFYEITNLLIINIISTII